MNRLACLVLFALPSLLWADPPTIEIPPEELVPVDGYVVMTPRGTAKGFTYVPLSGVNPLPSTILRDRRQFVLPVQGLAAGTYRFRAVGSLNDEHASREFPVTIGGPVPPGPTPPGPTPPTPPGPNPLTEKIQAAYDLAKDPTGLTALVAFYGRSMTAATDAALTTYGQLQARMRQLATETGARGRLRAVHDLLEKELAATLPTEVQRPLDDHGRTLARDAFARIHAALQGVKP